VEGSGGAKRTPLSPALIERSGVTRFCAAPYVPPSARAYDVRPHAKSSSGFAEAASRIPPYVSGAAIETPIASGCERSCPGASEVGSDGESPMMKRLGRRDSTYGTGCGTPAVFFARPRFHETSCVVHRAPKRPAIDAADGRMRSDAALEAGRRSVRVVPVSSQSRPRASSTRRAKFVPRPAE
jgi:hypothetical protein